VEVWLPEIELKENRMATLLLVLIYIAFISLGLPDALLGAGWPVMQPDLGVPMGFAGIVQFTCAGGTIISSICSGRIIRRFGTGKTTAVSVLLTAIALFGYSLAPSFLWLVVAAIPLGLGAGSVDAGLNAFVAHHYQSRHMNWLHSFWGLGALAGPLMLASLLAKGMPWRSGYAGIAWFQSVLVLILFISIPLWKKVGREDGSDFPSTTQSGVHMSIASLVGIKGVPAALVTFFVYTGVESTMGLWCGSYLFQTRGLDASSAARWVSFYYASITFGRFITGFITFHVSNRNLIRIGSLIVFVGILLMLTPFSLPLSLVGVLLVGFGCAPVFPCMLHETPVRFGVTHAQDVMGLQMAAAYIGSSLFPPLFGFLSGFLTLASLPVFLLAYALLLFFGSERLRKVIHKANG
jgi:fucose permease